MTINLTRKQALDRILKILALAEGSSFAGEAANARRMAEEMIARFNIDLEAEGKPARDEIAVKEHTPWGRKWLWERIIGKAVADLCGCAFYWHGDPDNGDGYSCFKFVGNGAAVEACTYVLAEVHLQRQRAWGSTEPKAGSTLSGDFVSALRAGLRERSRL
jgi:Protein of unknown function (DUF2786)